jgi:hypothetical protein
MTDNALIPMTALDRLRQTAQRSSADDFVHARTRRSLLLIDCSSSMGNTVVGGEEGERRIDALRKIVETLRTTHPVPMVSFPGNDIVERIPEPRGMTPLAGAIDFARLQEANHIVLVTDGVPDSRNAAYAAGDAFRGPIDVFYIGTAEEEGAAFCKELARRTGGKFGVTDLVGAPKLLAGKIQLLLGDGGSL